jgi:NADH-quinone oxidoreductase subunit K
MWNAECGMWNSASVFRTLPSNPQSAIRNPQSTKMPTLANYLIVSGGLFSIGLGGVLLRRNILIIFMGLELMLNAANLSLVAFSRFNLGQDGLPGYNAQVLVFFIITVAAAEVAVGLAIIVALYRMRQTTHVEDLDTLKF